MTSQTVKQIIPIHIMPNISRSQGNQTIKLDQSIEYHMRSICLETSYSKCGGETSLRPFSKKSNLIKSLDQQSKVLYSLFLLYIQVEGYQNMLKLSCWLLASTSYKAFSKK